MVKDVEQTVSGNVDGKENTEATYNFQAVTLILQSLIQVYKSEHNRIRAIEDKAGLLLASSGVFIGLVGRGLVEAWSTKLWPKLSGFLAIISLGAGVIIALRVISIASYRRLDTAFLCKGTTLAMPFDECEASLVAIWNEVVISIEERNKKKIKLCFEGRGRMQD